MGAADHMDGSKLASAGLKDVKIVLSFILVA